MRPRFHAQTTAAHSLLPAHTHTLHTTHTLPTITHTCWALSTAAARATPPPPAPAARPAAAAMPQPSTALRARRPPWSQQARATPGERAAAAAGAQGARRAAQRAAWCAGAISRAGAWPGCALGDAVKVGIAHWRGEWLVVAWGAASCGTVARSSTQCRALSLPLHPCHTHVHAKHKPQQAAGAHIPTHLLARSPPKLQQPCRVGAASSRPSERCGQSLPLACDRGRSGAGAPLSRRRHRSPTWLPACHHPRAPPPPQVFREFRVFGDAEIVQLKKALEEQKAVLEQASTWGGGCVGASGVRGRVDAGFVCWCTPGAAAAGCRPPPNPILHPPTASPDHTHPRAPRAAPPPTPLHPTPTLPSPLSLATQLKRSRDQVRQREEELALIHTREAVQLLQVGGRGGGGVDGGLS